MKGFVAISIFEVKRVLRSKPFLITTIGFPALFYSFFLKNAPHGGSTPIDNTIWSKYYMVSMVTYGTIVASFNAGGARMASERAAGWVRRLRLTPLSGPRYVLSKLISSMVVTLPTILLVEVVASVVGKVSLGVGTWVSITFLSWAASLVFSSLGVLMGFLTTSNSTQGISNVLLFGLTFVGGLFTPTKFFPKGLQAVAKWLPTYNMATLGWSRLGVSVSTLHSFLILLAYTLVFCVLLLRRYRSDQAVLVK